jgi:CDP-glucose 4,6-dehydratase
VRWLVERLGEAWGMDRAWRPEPAEQLPEAHQLRLDSSKARRRLGWHPRLSLSSALAWTSEWYLAHREAADLRAKTSEQIQRYEALPGPC